MAPDGKARLDELAWLRDVPEHPDALEPYFGPELRPGFVLDGRFVIGGPISRSGMATIYQAQDALDHHRLVAVKVPHLSYEADPNCFSRFQREEEVGLGLNHPFVLKFIPVEKKSRPYLVTEYLHGWTLLHLLSAMHPLPEQDALKIASLVCDALQHLHQRGVIHRDLKPGNIMICRDRTIRVMDFGIASSAAARKITISGLTATLGTPEYMSPEQVKNERGDERSDIYGLGTVLYEMLTGAVPFQHENCWVTMNRRVTGDPVAPRTLNPQLSPQAEEIVLHALQRAPADRFQTAAEFKNALDAPDRVRVTGYCDRLQAPCWRLSLRETPVLAGTLLGVGFLALQVLGFLLLRHLLAK
ncbi:MAG: serine/threonine protein kinase [Verrucomicrobia bacterium]|nr:serine/threonine protein kinase [Verrucomicrobiota bacterium]